MSERRPWLPGVLLAVLFLAGGLAARGDFGVTWDEHETHQASQAAFARGFTFHAVEPGGPEWHVLPGYYFVLDYGRGLFHHLFSERLGWLDWSGSQHLFHLVLSSLTVLLLYGMALQLSGGARFALWAALALVSFPKFVGHSQNNPKDLPALFAFTLAGFAFTRFHARASWGSALLAGAALGFAFSARELALALPVVFGAWLTWSEGPGLRAFVGKGMAALLVAALVFLACWPWLWPDPLGRLLGVAQHVGSFTYDRKVLYLGTIQRAGSMPWHYTLVSLLVAVPVGHSLALGLSALDPGPERRAAFRRIRRLGWIWCAVLFALDALAAAHYDGARHLLVVLPGLCLLVGLGLETLARRAGSRLGAWGAAVPLALLGVAGLGVWRTHPYQDAFLTEGLTPFVAGRGEELFELEYWGGAYQEGAEWLNTHAEPHARIYLPELCPAQFTLRRPWKTLDPQEFADPALPSYLMTLTRKAFYGREVASVVREYEPVFEVRRAEGTLLRIYKNERRRVP